MTLVMCSDHGTALTAPQVLGHDVVGIPALCGDPSALHDDQTGEPGALILHSGEFDLGFVQGAIRKAGVEPLGVPIVTLPERTASDRVEVLAAGALAHHDLFPGAGPEHAKMRWPELISRRRLFALGVPQYVGAPSVNPTLCSGQNGCRLCIDACPTSALAWGGSSISYSVDTCVACGTCATTCPTGATVNPTTTPGQITAQISAMVAAAADPIGIEFRCRDARPGDPADDWYPVEVPCTGMLTIGWLLAPLALGAGAVATTPCGDSGCSIGNDELLAARLSEALLICEQLGIVDHAVTEVPRDSVPQPLHTVGSRSLSDLHDTDVYLALAAISSVTEATFPSTTGAVGVVEIDEQVCTVCEQCTTVCPSQALAAEQSGGTIEITFDPILCVGCNMCVTTCPEQGRGAITLHREFDVKELALGRRVVRSEPAQLCVICGDPIAPTAMLERIGSMLGPEHGRTLDLIARRCVACRQYPR